MTNIPHIKHIQLVYALIRNQAYGLKLLGLLQLGLQLRIAIFVVQFPTAPESTIAQATAKSTNLHICTFVGHILLCKPNVLPTLKNVENANVV